MPLRNLAGARPNRRTAAWVMLVASTAMLWGCGGSDGGSDDDAGQPLYRAFNDLRAGTSPEQVQRVVGLTPSGSNTANPLVWETERERLEVTFQRGVIVSARWTDRQNGRTFLRTFRVSGNGGGSVQPGTLYEAYLALRPGMTRAEVIRMVPVQVSQGANTSQVLWVQGQEALGVRFNGSTDASVITFAQWGLSLSAGGRDESRSF